jgi:hypothetical protein
MIIAVVTYSVWAEYNNLIMFSEHAHPVGSYIMLAIITNLFLCLPIKAEA